MQPFAYARPGSLTEALELLREHGARARVLAGGTDLIVELRNRSVAPEIVIDLKRVAELQPRIEVRDGMVSVAALTSMTDVHDDEGMRRRFPALVDAAETVGSIQIRNRATLTGNVCHASPAADTAPALLVYGAEAEVASARGSRRVSLRDFFVGPRRTVLGPDELVTSILLPVPAERTAATFARMTRRKGVDLATVNLCCLVSAEGRTTFAYGAVGPRPFAVDDGSGVLGDPRATDAEKERLLGEMVAHASPISDVRGSREYRAAMLMVMSRRALRSALAKLQAP
jgi:CO/xanthine dehydrogenase FAD-binding subunit